MVNSLVTGYISRLDIVQGHDNKISQEGSWQDLIASSCLWSYNLASSIMKHFCGTSFVGLELLYPRWSLRRVPKRQELGDIFQPSRVSAELWTPAEKWPAKTASMLRRPPSNKSIVHILRARVAADGPDVVVVVVVVAVVAAVRQLLLSTSFKEMTSLKNEERQITADKRCLKTAKLLVFGSWRFQRKHARFESCKDSNPQTFLQNDATWYKGGGGLLLGGWTGLTIGIVGLGNSCSLKNEAFLNWDHHSHLVEAVTISCS